MKRLDDIKRYYIYSITLKRFILPIMVVYMLEQGLSIEQIALIAAVGWTLSAVFEVPSGAIADWIGHKRALMISNALQGISMLLYLGGSFEWILAATSLYFAGGTLMTGTRQALFFERLKEMGLEKEYKKYSGRAKSVANGAGIIAMALAGLAYTVTSWLPFVLGAGIYVIGIVVISGFQEAKRHVSVEKREGFMGLLLHFPQAIKTIRKEPFLMWMIIINTFAGGITFASHEFHQILLTNVGLAVTLFGIVWAIKRIISTIISPFVHRVTEHVSPPTIMTLMNIFTIVYFILISIAKTPTAMVGIFLGAVVIYTFRSVATGDYANQLIKSGSRATTLSVGALSESLVIAGTVGIMGLLAATHTLEGTYAIAGIALLILMIIPTIFIYRAYAKNSFEAA